MRSWLMWFSGLVLGATSVSSYDNWHAQHRHDHYANLANSPNPNVSGCALVALIDDYSDGEYRKCVKEGKISGSIIKRTDNEPAAEEDNAVEPSTLT